ncbi:MerR family transcriptional regulator [Sediminicoccus rosea]|uniref:MerR family transcriptional regulator n=1 Tax=Sediminicoccus rosea TaxID=1225128 RepID=UPI00384A86EB
MTGRTSSGAPNASQTRPSRQPGASARSDVARQFGASAPEAPPLSESAVPEPLVTPGHVAWLFGICSRTLSNWEQKGVLAPIRIRGRRYYRPEDVRKLWEEGRR